MRRRSGRVPRWMWGVLVVLVLLAVGEAARRGMIAPTSGTAPTEPFVAPHAHQAIAEARAQAIEGDSRRAATRLVELADRERGTATSLGERTYAVLRFEAEAMLRAAGLPVDERGLQGTFAILDNVETAPGRARLGMHAAKYRVLDRAPAGLDDPWHPGFGLACAHMEMAFGQPAGVDGGVVEWVRNRARPDRRVRLVPALLLTAARSGVPGPPLQGQVQRLVDKLDRDELESVLARVASDVDLDPLLRRVCERWLGEIADIPVGLSRDASVATLERDTFPEGEIVASWERLQAMSPEESLRERLRVASLEHAVAGMDGARTDLPALHHWIERHTDIPPAHVDEPRELDPWSEPDTDLVARTAARLGGTTDVAEIVRAMAEGRPERAAGHVLLELLADPSVRRPVWMASAVDAPQIVVLWRRALRLPPEAVRVRLSRWELAAGRWRLVPEGDDVVDVSEVYAQIVEHSRALPDVPELSLRARVPGGDWHGHRAPLYRQTLWLSLDREPEGLVLGTRAMSALVRPSGSIVAHGGHEPASCEVVSSPDSGLGRSVVPDRLRNHLTMLRPEPACRTTATGPAWDATDWRRAIATDLGRLATLAEASEPAWEFHNRHQRTVQNLAAICMTLQVPEALPPLRRLLAVAPAWNARPTTDHLLLAALRSGATDLVEHPGVRVLARGVAVGDYVEATIGHGPKFWVRLLYDARDSATRELAVAAIAGSTEMTPELATDLHDAIDAGVVAPHPSLDRLLAGYPSPAPDTFSGVARAQAPVVVAVCSVVAALVVLGLIGLVGALRGRWWPRVGGVLVALGVVASAFSVRVAGVALLPAPLPLAVAAVGALLLWRVTRSRAAAVAVVALLLAASVPSSWQPVENAATFVSVLAVTVLGRDVLRLLPGPDRRAPRRPAQAASRRFLVFAVALAASGAVGVAGITTGGGRGGTWVVVALAAAAAGWALGLMAPAIARHDPAAPRRALPPVFVLAYIVPVGGLLLLRAFEAAGLGAGWTPDTDDKLFVALVALPAAAVVWSLGRLLEATRGAALSAR